MLTLKIVPSPKTPKPRHPQECCVNAHGFSLHAELRCAMNQRNQLERPGRYITRPAIANERLTRNRAGEVVPQLKSPYQDGAPPTS
ncbi:MAG: transposase [Methylococcales bacterium]